MGRYVVTGGASGIGAAIREQLEARGDTVVVVDIKDADITANLGTGEGRSSAIAAIREATADGIAGLVTCAGLGSHVPDGALITQVNYFGTVALIAGLRDHLADHQATVLLISSNSAPMETRADYVEALLRGDEEAATGIAADMTSHQVYSGSKQAVVRWMRANTRDYAAAGVRMNALAPGYTRTPLSAAVEDDPTYGQAIKDFIASIPLGRPGEPEDIANAASFLLSESAGFVCGSVLFVDGGHDAMLRPDQF